MKILVTGGAGFIGSELVKKLLDEDNQIIIIDNLSAEISEQAKIILENKKILFHEIDCIKCNEIKDDILKCEQVFHFAANPDVKKGQSNPDLDFHNNSLATYNLLKCLSKSNNLKKFIFSSSSVVYGEAKIIPTPENYGPLLPISFYGATKLADEAMISAFSHKHDFNSYFFRFANIIGSQSTHGVIFDFIKKLKMNSDELEILGDGKQSKSYLHISDCIKGIMKGNESSRNINEIFNLGTDQQTSTTEIAKIITMKMQLSETKFKFKTSFQKGRGWSGDVTNMILDCSKIKNLGWKPQFSSDEAIKQTVDEILNKN